MALGLQCGGRCLNIGNEHNYKLEKLGVQYFSKWISGNNVRINMNNDT